MVSTKKKAGPIGQLIRSRLKEMGKSQYWLAKQLSMDPPHLTSIIQGKIKCPDMKTLLKLSAALAIPLETFANAAYSKGESGIE